jgi:hypothetical protein
MMLLADLVNFKIEDFNPPATVDMMVVKIPHQIKTALSKCIIIIALNF